MHHARSSSQPTSESEYTLHYFPIRGLGELPRMILEVGGLTYRNTYPVDWPKEKSSSPFGQVPLLVEKHLATGNEFKLAQSGSISRYLARKIGIAGSNEKEAATIESVYEALVDIRTHWLKAFYAPEVDKKKAMDLFFADNFVGWSNFFERYLDHSSGDFIIGDKLTYPDLLLFILVEAWIEHKPEILGGRPNMKKVYTSVLNHPKVTAYIRSDRRHQPTFHSSSKKA